LEFRPPCALIGYHQAVELEVEEKYCREHGIEINRRITGGGSIYLDEGQLGWEIFVHKDTPQIPKNLEDMYRRICEGAIAGLARLGVKAEFRPKNDIEVDGRKISGSGGAEFEKAILYHGTLLTDFDVDTMIKCLKLPIHKLDDKPIQSFKKRVICLREVLGYLPSLAVIKRSLVEGFMEFFKIRLEPGDLTEHEKRLLEKDLPRFQSEEWIRGMRPKPQNSTLRVVDHKTRGGLIRVSVLLDPTRHRVKSAFITGDFFAYPERSILDLEAALKDSSSHSPDIFKTVTQFFAERGIRIPGLEPNDFYQAICLAVTTANVHQSRP
jgi:lipoate-protein ligase A